MEKIISWEPTKTTEVFLIDMINCLRYAFDQAEVVANHRLICSGKLDQVNHGIVVTSSLHRKAPFSKWGLAVLKRKAGVFKFLRF